MLTRPWIDPRDVDWTDPLNPLRNPGWQQNNNPYVWAALKDPMLQALRQGKGIEPRLYVCPDPNSQTIPGNSTYDYEVPAEPNCWLFALNASGSGTDFLLQITDSVTGAKVFSQPTPMSLINSNLTGTSNRGKLFFLTTPHLFEPPSYPVVRLINTESTAKVCAVNLFTCVEYDTA